MNTRYRVLALCVAVAGGAARVQAKRPSDLSQPAVAWKVLAASQFVVREGSQDCRGIASDLKKRKLGELARHLRGMANRDFQLSCKPAANPAQWSCEVFFSYEGKPGPDDLNPPEADWTLKYEVRDDVVQSLICLMAG